MIRIALPDAEVRRLEEILWSAADPKLRHRVQIVLMAHRGHRHADIAADTATTPRSVQRWLNAPTSTAGWTGYNPARPRGLHPS